MSARDAPPAADYADLIDVMGSGAVILGPDVTSDGFHQDRRVRVQTHIHTDHMGDFSTSKSRDLVMSIPVKDLLARDHPDFHFRANIHALQPGETWSYGGATIALQPAGHMLGASQVVVELSDGRRLGYSGDFSWPLDRPIEVNALVVDATYGSPDSDRSYDQSAADASLADLIRERLRFGPIQLLGNPAVIERALMVATISEVAHCGVELLARILDEPVELRLVQDSVYPFVKYVARCSRQLRGRNPQRVLSVLSPSHSHIAIS